MQEHRNEQKANDLFFNTLLDNTFFNTPESIESLLMKVYDNSTDSIKGNLYEATLNEYISKDSRFECIRLGKKSHVTFYLPSVIHNRVCMIVKDVRNKKIDLRNKNTLDYILHELFKLVHNAPKVDMERYNTQIDLLFKEKNYQKYYYYEIKTSGKQDGRTDMGTLMSFLMIYCYLIDKYNISTFDDLEIGIIFMERNELYNSKYIAMTKNGGVTFKEFCERFYDFETYKYFMESILNGVYFDKEDIKPYINKVAKVFIECFKGRTFTKSQLISKVQNTSYRI